MAKAKRPLLRAWAVVCDGAPDSSPFCCWPSEKEAQEEYDYRGTAHLACTGHDIFELVEQTKEKKP